MRWLSCGLIVSLALFSLPVTAVPAGAASNPAMLALATGGFPAGAVITHLHLDTTAAGVNRENFFSDHSPVQGTLYQQLHFAGALVENVQLPSFNGTPRALWLMATIFPSAAAAATAYASDADLGHCESSPAVSLPIPATTCAYTLQQEADFYIIATTGPVDFAVVGFVSANSPAALQRAVRDATYVAQQEARHVMHLVALGRLPTGELAPASAWHVQHNPNSGTTRGFAGIACPGPATCYAVGSAILATTIGGQSWQVQMGHPQHFLTAIACPGVRTCLAVGAGGAIVTTIDGGSTWQPRSSGTTRDLFGVACSGPGTCLAVGANGTILTTSDGGQSWLSRRNPDSGTTHDVDSVSCPGVRVCYTVGYSTLATTDGGISWQAQSGSPTYYLLGIACSQPRVCLAVGGHGTIIGTNNGGVTWTGRPGITHAFLHNIGCTAVGVCFAVGQGGTIIRSADGGRSWSVQLSPSAVNLWGLTCARGGACYSVGDNGTILAR